MKQEDKNSICCGGAKFDFSKFGVCRFCMSLAIICTLLSGGFLVLCRYKEWELLSVLAGIWVILFGLASILHLIGFLNSKKIKNS